MTGIKGTYIRTRLTERTRADFDAVCQRLGISPSEQLRLLIETFLADNPDAAGARSVVNIYQPEGYDFGAWRVSISLSDPADASWNGTFIPFELPALPHRRIVSDTENQTVVRSKKYDELVFGGKFDDAGVWRGHVYSNGIPENKNPSSIDSVKEALHDMVTKILGQIHGGSKQGGKQFIRA